jgi:hypothetical protein
MEALCLRLPFNARVSEVVGVIWAAMLFCADVVEREGNPCEGILVQSVVFAAISRSNTHVITCGVVYHG